MAEMRSFIEITPYYFCYIFACIYDPSYFGYVYQKCSG